MTPSNAKPEFDHIASSRAFEKRWAEELSIRGVMAVATPAPNEKELAARFWAAGIFYQRDLEVEAALEPTRKQRLDQMTQDAQDLPGGYR